MRARLGVIFIIVVLLCGCRVNNGDIGPFFGSWLLYDFTVDGDTPENFNPEATFWEFQNNIISICRVEFMYEREIRLGTWTEDDGEIILNFTHYQAGTPPGTGQYLAPEWLGFPPNSEVTLTFVEQSSKRMVLKWHNDLGQTLVYSLRKIW